MSTTDPTPAAKSRRTRVLGFVVGLAFLAAAIWSVAGNANAITRLRLGVSDAPAWVLVMLLVIPISNWLLTGALFHTLTRPRANVSLGHMTALIGAAWLLNFFPFSPGFFGRVAYQKSVLSIPVRTSVRIVVESLVAGWVVFAFALASAHDATHRAGQVAWLGASAVCIVYGLLVPIFRRTPPSLGSAYAAAFLLKSFDFALWSLRYMLLLILLGHPAEPTHAVALALLAQTAVLVPFIGNGLGVREWLVGLVAAVLPTWFIFASSAHTVAPPIATGVAADLLGRAAEVIVAVPVGLACAAYLANRARTAESVQVARSDPSARS